MNLTNALQFLKNIFTVECEYRTECKTRLNPLTCDGIPRDNSYLGYAGFVNVCSPCLELHFEAEFKNTV